MTISKPTCPSWITLIKENIKHGNFPADPSEATLVKKISSEYKIFRGIFYKRGLSIPFLRCLEKTEASYALIEMHKRIIRHDPKASTLAKKSGEQDTFANHGPTAGENVKKYNQCQQHWYVFNAPSTDLHVLTLPWSIMQWDRTSLVHSLLPRSTQILDYSRWIFYQVDQSLSFGENYNGKCFKIIQEEHFGQIESSPIHLDRKWDVVYRREIS